MNLSLPNCGAIEMWRGSSIYPSHAGSKRAVLVVYNNTGQGYYSGDYRLIPLY